jgi:glycyl-tRNA synthetase
VLDPAERRRLVLEQGRALAASVGGEMEADDELTAEVANLVEAPQALLGSFDPAFLSLPPEVLVAVMKKHQRYFPIRDRAGRLLPRFVTVADGARPEVDEIRAGNEHVLRARFSDAGFFLARDRQGSAEVFRARTAIVTFHARLGSMLDKTARVERLVALLASRVLRLDDATAATAARAAFLCKADLATAMVTEMTSLQGVIGRIYAREWGESEEVAQAVFDHHLPRFAGDGLPASEAGMAVGIADRLDTLAGLFAAGMQPTGTRDPFALRRTAVGLIQILVARGLRLDVGEWLAEAGRGLPIPFSDDSLKACLTFLAARHESLLLADGRRYDVVAAVLAAQAGDPAGAARAVAELEAATADTGWPLILQAYARCARIVPRPSAKDSEDGRGMHGQKADGRVDPRQFTMDAERSLLDALETISRPAAVTDLVDGLRRLVPAITEFFDKVLVMDKDAEVRANRLALVRRVVTLADGIADLSKLEGF